VTNKLVFVDDDILVLSAYQRMLKTAGFHCDFEQLPETVLYKTDLSDVSVLLVDQRMPGINGTELLSALNGKFPNMKRVLLTADIVAAKRAMVAGVNVDAVLAKPCSKLALINCIKQLVDNCSETGLPSNADQF
jgi:FixJ family two-component response regulator